MHLKLHYFAPKCTLLYIIISQLKNKDEHRFWSQVDLNFNLLIYKTGLMTVVIYSAYLSLPRPVLTLYALTHLIRTAVLRAENRYTHSTCTGLRQG